MMRDSANFADPLTFNAFRSVGEAANRDSASANTTTKTGLTDSSDSWLVWGAGRILCPGRFYATVVLKLFVAHLITEYDIVLPESKTARSMQWRSAVIPKPSVVLLVRPKTKTKT
jgi:cytochrome P450